jgi:hypothetical protein
VTEDPFADLERVAPADLDSDSGPDLSRAAPGGFPWPPAHGESVISAWGRTWHGSALAPRTFFSAMPRAGSLGAAVLYYLSIGIPVAGAQLFWSMIRGTASESESATVLGATGAWNPLLEFLFSPLLLLLSLVLASGVTHLMLKLFGGGGGRYGTTLRVFAYSYSPQLLGVIPVAGTIVGFIWMVVIAIAGLREAHGTTTARAVAAVLIPLTIGLIIVALVELLVRAGGLLEMPV